MKRDYSAKPKGKKISENTNVERKKRDRKKRRKRLQRQLEITKSIIVSTGDINQEYEIIGPVYYQINSKGWFSSKPLKKMIEFYEEFFKEKRDIVESSPRVSTMSTIGSVLFLGELNFGMANLFESAFYISVEEMKLRTHQMGGDAIIFMRQDIDLDTNLWQNFYMQAYGTVVKLKT